MIRIFCGSLGAAGVRPFFWSSGCRNFGICSCCLGDGFRACRAGGNSGCRAAVRITPAAGRKRKQQRRAQGGVFQEMPGWRGVTFQDVPVVCA